VKPVGRSVTLLPWQDAYVNRRRPDSSFGRRIALKVGRDWDRSVFRSFLRFDLSCFATGTRIKQAELYLSVRQNPSGPVPKAVAIKPVLRGWSERNISWNNQPRAGHTVATELVDEGSGETVAFDVTGLAQSWLTGALRNHGLMLQAPDEARFSYVKFGSRERRIEDLRPRLVVALAEPCPPTPGRCFRNVVEADLRITNTPRGVLLQDVGRDRMTTYIVRNHGDAAVRTELQLSPDAVTWLDDPPVQVVPPGETAALVPRLYMRFARLRLQTQEPGETAHVTIWFQAQSAC